jgi:hypothetical protein
MGNIGNRFCIANIANWLGAAARGDWQVGQVWQSAENRN